MNANENKYKKFELTDEELKHIELTKDMPEEDKLNDQAHMKHMYNSLVSTWENTKQAMDKSYPGHPCYKLAEMLLPDIEAALDTFVVIEK